MGQLVYPRSLTAIGGTGKTRQSRVESRVWSLKTSWVGQSQANQAAREKMDGGAGHATGTQWMSDPLPEMGGGSLGHPC